MIRELLDAVVGKAPREELVGGMNTMLSSATHIARQGIDSFWAKASTRRVTELAKADAELNLLAQDLKKELVVSLTVYRSYSPTPLLSLMSVMKDVERLGDYGKNLASARALAGELPQDETTAELRTISGELTALLDELPEVVRGVDRKRAASLSLQGHARAQRCRAVIERVAKSSYDAAAASALTLSAQYHKRIQGHILNILTSLVMPLHKLDEFDEVEFARAASCDA